MRILKSLMWCIWRQSFERGARVRFGANSEDTLGKNAKVDSQAMFVTIVLLVVLVDHRVILLASLSQIERGCAARKQKGRNMVCLRPLANHLSQTT